MDSSTTTSNKKQCLDQSFDWKITFDQTQGLRTLVDVVCNILTRVNMRITKDQKQGAHFLCIDSIDPQHVCMIQARLVCEKLTGDLTTDVEFCVDSNILNTCLKSIPPHYSLDLIKPRGGADIKISAYETLSNSHCLSFDLSTLCDDSETMQLSDMEYKYTVEIDLGTLRQIVKMAMALRSSVVEMRVDGLPDDSTQRAKHTVLSISARGDATLKHEFFSATVQEEGDGDSCIIRAATDSTSSEMDRNRLVEMYSDAFSAQYMTFFLKSMERQMITMKLSKDKPLIMHYPLGAEASYICFVLAPKTVDE